MAKKMKRKKKKVVKCPDCGKKVKDIPRHKPYCKALLSEPVKHLETGTDTDFTVTTTEASSPDLESEKELRTAKDLLKIPDDEVGPKITEEKSQRKKGLPISAELTGKMISLPFSMWANMAHCKALALTPGEKEELGELGKKVFDEYMPGWLKDNGDIFLFSTALAFVVTSKAAIYTDLKNGGVDNGESSSTTEKTEANDSTTTTREPGT